MPTDDGRATPARVRCRSGPCLSPSVPDLLAPGLRLVLVGINPGRASAAAAAHFANPRNDFWRLLEASGLTPELLGPERQAEVLRHGIGITNAALRTTPGSGDLRAADFAGSAARLERIARELRPGVMAFVGKEAYRGTFGERPELGLQAGSSATPGCSCCRRRRPPTPRSRGRSASGGSTRSPRSWAVTGTSGDEAQLEAR